MPVKLSHNSQLKDMNQFFVALNHQVRNGTFCDVVLVCDSGQRIVGHKAILAASSPYFYNLFTATEPSQEPIDTTANFDTMATFDTMANFDTTKNSDTSVNPHEGINGVQNVVKKVLSNKDSIKVFGICGIKYRYVQAIVDCIYQKQIILDDPEDDFDTFIQVAHDTFGVVIDKTTFITGNGFGTFDPLQTGSSALQVVGSPLLTGSRKGKKRGMNQAIDLSTKVGATVPARSSSAGRLLLAEGLSSVGESSSVARSVSSGIGRKLKGMRGGSSSGTVPTSAGTVPTSAGAVPTSAGAVPTSGSAGNDATKHQSLEALRSLTAGHHGSMSSLTRGPMSSSVQMNHPFQSFVQQNWNPIYSQAMTNWTQGWNQNQIQGRYQSIFGQNRDQVTFVGSERDGTCDNGHEKGGYGHVASVAKDSRIKCIWEGCKKYFRSDNSMMAHLLSTHYQVILKCPNTGCSKKCIKSATFMNHVASHAEFVQPELLKSHLVKVIEECKRKAEEQLEALNGQEDMASKVASEPVTKKRKKNSSGVDLSRRPSQVSTAVCSSANVTSKSASSANVTSKSSPSPTMLFVSPTMTLSPLKSVPSISSVSSESGKKVIPIRGTQVDRVEYIGSESDEETEGEEEEKIGNGSKSESRKVTSSQG